MTTVADERLDAVFGALADPTRRALLVTLARSPASIGELAEPFDMSLPAVSKHIRVLERAGLVRRAVEGRVHHCSFDPRPLREADRWISSNEQFWGHQLDSLASYVERDDRD
jgi:DNA-binding transcriptional ArsR family regulator